MKKLLLLLLVLIGSFRDATAQCPQNAFAFISPYAQCPSGCVVLLKDWPEGVIVNIYGGSPISVITTALIQGTFGGPGTGDAFVCVPCNIPLIFASIVPGAANGCVIIPLGTLPVKLTDFTVTSTGNKSCIIKWNTSDEPGSTRYTLQKSTDSRNFLDIITFIGKGKPLNNYSYEDRSLAVQDFFYRIKTTEVTGKINFSEVILLKNKTGMAVTIYPNPAKSDFKITIPAQFLPASVIIYNAEGKGVHSLTTMQSNITINKKLPNGVYAIKITGKNNELVTDRISIR